jgi:hypothetical protein
MNYRVALLAAVFIIGSAGGPAVGLASADVTLTVTVETAAGAPVSDAELTASWDGGSTTATTASNGKAFLDVPEGANVTIEVDHPNYVRNSPYTLTNASEEDVTVTVWEKASATVTVADSDGPVEGVRVVFRKAGEIVTVRTSDASGTVESGVIESGEYTLTFFEPGYLRKAVTIEIRGETTEEVTIERGSVTVEFQVLDDNFDPAKPIAEATISSDEIGSVLTGPDGQRAVSVPVNTELTVTVEKSAYETVTETIVVRESNKQVNITTRRVPAVNIELSNERVVVGETVEVSVTDEYGEPVPEATVLLDGSEMGQTDASGTLRIPIETAGEHTVFVSFQGLSSERVTVTGIESEPGESPADEGIETTAGPGDSDQDGGLLGGSYNLSSIAIGVAVGLLLAVLLFSLTRRS